jgi:hypothetical protein
MKTLSLTIHNRQDKQNGQKFYTPDLLIRGNKTRCVVNATNAPALSQSFKAMFNLFQFQGG